MPAGLDGARDRVRSLARQAVVDRLAGKVASLAPHPNLLVGIDGASATGKSTLADELAEALQARDLVVVRASIDSFHRPRRERYHRGPDSPEGYYLDSHDLVALQDRLLTPFVTGVGSYVTAVFDEPSDAPVDQVPLPVPADAVLVFDGLFLQRPELKDAWDLLVFLTAERRRAQLWAAYPDGPRKDRYLVGQALYEEQVDPWRRAAVVIDNDDLARPRRVVWR
ncbi:MAG: uridine kinase [Acidimicrobiia bacterium]|nr:uridine kinase [Acidimicrobiia bacterium]